MRPLQWQKIEELAEAGSSIRRRSMREVSWDVLVAVSKAGHAHVLKALLEHGSSQDETSRSAP